MNITVFIECLSRVPYTFKSFKVPAYHFCRRASKKDDDEKHRRGLLKVDVIRLIFSGSEWDEVILDITNYATYQHH